MGDTKILATVCLALLLWVPQSTTAIDIAASVACTLTNTGAAYSLTMDMYIDDSETDSALVTQKLLPYDTGTARIAPDLCTPLSATVFPVVESHNFDTTYHATLIEPVATATTILISDLATCNPVLAGTVTTIIVGAAIYDDVETSEDTVITFMCDCDPTAMPSATSCFGDTQTVAAYSPPAPVGNAVTASNALSVVTLELYDCATDAAALPAVILGACVYLHITYTFDVANARDGVTPANINPYNCYAYKADPFTVFGTLNEPFVQITDTEGCPITGSSQFAPAYGLYGNRHKGDGAFSPVYWRTGEFPMSKFRGSAEVWFKCSTTYCVYNQDSACYGKSNRDRCNPSNTNANTVSGNTGRKRRDVEKQANQTESLVTSRMVVYEWQNPADNLNQNAPVESDTCFQNASFLAIVVTLLLLVLVAMCVSLVLCYKLRNRHHRNEQHIHEKHGVDNSSM